MIWCGAPVTVRSARPPIILIFAVGEQASCSLLKPRVLKPDRARVQKPNRARVLKPNRARVLKPNRAREFRPTER